VGLRALVAVQLAALLVVAVATVARFPVWALVDEAAHFDYVQWIAEDGRLPVLDEDPVHTEVLAIDEGVYPDPPRVPAEERGLFGRSYEGFQPPLAHLVATPVYAAAGEDHERKLRALRALGVALLAVAVWLTWLLARRAVPEAPLAAFSLALTFFLWPGVVVRAGTFSNAALEIAVGAAMSLALWRALSERSERWLVAAGALTGAALLTKLTMLAFVPALAVVGFAFVREGRWLAVAAAGALPAAIVAPWVIANLGEYGAPTGSDEVQALMEPTLNPDRVDYGPGDLPGKHVALLNGVLPDEWWVEFLSTAKRRLRDVLVGLVIAAPLLAAVRVPPVERRRALTVLVLPLGAGILLMSVSLLAENWDAFYPRYLYGALPGFAVFAGLALMRALGERAVLWSSGVLTVLLLGLWAHLSGVTPATV
jgi:4-amino-4-deoxy-L-arabinose transferase-like glycosyltransferase